MQQSNLHLTKEQNLKTIKLLSLAIFLLANSFANAANERAKGGTANRAVASGRTVAQQKAYEAAANSTKNTIRSHNTGRARK